MTTESKVAGHYTQGRLEQAIFAAIDRMGKRPAELKPEDLAPIDEFHVGGLEATAFLAERLDLQPGMHLLDVGSGIGGPARYYAARHNCQVTGIDLTEEFVGTAKALTKFMGLESRAQFHHGSALQLPFADRTFDHAYMIHVGMNVPDKQGVYREVRRVLKPGGVFAIFDFVRNSDGAIRYPLPWAATEETSFVESADDYRRALEAAGLKVVHEQDRREFAIEFTKRAMARAAQPGAPPIGLQLLMGERTREMIQNVTAMMEAGTLAPMEIYGKA